MASKKDQSNLIGFMAASFLILLAVTLILLCFYANGGALCGFLGFGTGLVGIIIGACMLDNI